ncbi:MAG: hypothetical protein WCZ23_07640 [Rhodospirillaceae bacterium]
MDILQPIVVAAVRPVNPAPQSDRSPRAIAPAGEGFSARLTQDRQAEEAAPHGTPTRPMYFSLLSAGMQDSLRQLFLRGLSYRLDDSATFRQSKAKEQDGLSRTSQDAAQEQSFTSYSFSVVTGDSAPDGTFRSLLRRATFAYAQGLSASPSFSFARRAEVMNLVA